MNQRFKVLLFLLLLPYFNYGQNTFAYRQIIEGGNNIFAENLNYFLEDFNGYIGLSSRDYGIKCPLSNIQ